MPDVHMPDMRDFMWICVTTCLRASSGFGLDGVVSGNCKAKAGDITHGWKRIRGCKAWAVDVGRGGMHARCCAQR